MNFSGLFHCLYRVLFKFKLCLVILLGGDKDEDMKEMIPM